MCLIVQFIIFYMEDILHVTCCVHYVKHRKQMKFTLFFVVKPYSISEKDLYKEKFLNKFVIAIGFTNENIVKNLALHLFYAFLI